MNIGIPKILQVQNLTGAVRAFDFTDEFPTKRLSFLFPEQRIKGDRAELDVIYSSARAPKFVSPGAPSVSRSLTDRGTISVRMPYIKEHFFINAELLAALRQAGKEEAQPAVAKLAEELEESTRAVARGIELLKFRALSPNYQIVLDDRLVTLDDPYRPSHKPTVDWKSNPSADIRGAITEFKRLVAFDSGRRLTHALLNSKTLGVLYDNELFRTFVPGSERVSDVLDQVEELRLFGITWVVWDAFYVDPWDGQTKPYIEDDIIVFVPSSPDWSELQVGQVHYVNDNGEIARDWGPVSWSEVVRNPVGAVCYVAWCGLAVVKVPDAVVIATVS